MITIDKQNLLKNLLAIEIYISHANTHIFIKKL